jgi:hypothetical protein
LSALACTLRFYELTSYKPVTQLLLEKVTQAYMLYV